jgi:hypothetical protein
MLNELDHFFHDVTNALWGKMLTPRAISDVRRLGSKVVKLNQLEHW